MQPIHIAFDALSGVDGSARFSFGQITAVASVSGPIAARLTTEHPARATVEVHVRPLSSVPGTAEKHTAIALKGIIERTCILAQHPRSLIQVVVQALSPSPSPSSSSSRSHTPQTSLCMGIDTEADVLLAAEVNACSLALLNSGSIPLRGVVCAVAVTQSAGGRPQIVTQDDSTRNKNSIESAGCFVFLLSVDRGSAEVDPVAYDIPPRPKMIWTNYHASIGRAFSATALEETEKVASEGAAEVWAKMKESLA